MSVTASLVSPVGKTYETVERYTREVRYYPKSVWIRSAWLCSGIFLVVADRLHLCICLLLVLSEWATLVTGTGIRYYSNEASLLQWNLCFSSQQRKMGGTEEMWAELIRTRSNYVNSESGILGRFETFQQGINFSWPCLAEHISFALL